jgi:hypothetical protein
MAEIHFVDGAVHGPTDFGSFDANGYWIPKVVTGITYGTNGFYLDFSDNTSTTTLGEDQTANGNDWTLDNMATTDQVTDSPTDKCPIVWAEKSSGVTFSEGNLRMNLGSYDRAARTHGLPIIGKYYWEVESDLTGTGSSYGIHDITLPVGNPALASPNHTNHIRLGSTGNIAKDTTTVFTGGTAPSNGAIIMFAADFDAKLLWVGVNGTWFNSGDPAAGTGYVTTLHNGVRYGINCLSSSADTTAILNTGQRTFSHTAPSGFVAPTENNITVDDQNLESPDFVWIKNRDQADKHHLYDSVRGIQEALYSSATTAETNEPNGLLDFNANGFTIGSEAEVNTLNEDYVSWTWKAGGTAVENTDGSITSSVSANTESGFSIVSYTGDDAASATVGHGLSQAPEMVIVKNRQEAISNPAWPVYHSSLGATKFLDLQTTAAEGTATSVWNDTAPTSSLVTIGTADSVNSGSTHIMYCFHSVEGFSKFGSYTGNGSTDGPFVYTGFRPAFVMTKRTNSTNNWVVVDTARSPENVNDNILYANLSNAEVANETIDFDLVSNGFKLRSGTAGNNNTSGSSYIYMAFAENPFKYATAR